MPSTYLRPLSTCADVDIKCASTYFRYGAALFYKAQDEQDVFGATLQAAAAHEDAEAAEEESSGKRHSQLNTSCVPVGDTVLCVPSMTPQNSSAFMHTCRLVTGCLHARTDNSAN